MPIQMKTRTPINFRKKIYSIVRNSKEIYQKNNIMIMSIKKGYHKNIKSIEKRETISIQSINVIASVAFSYKSYLHARESFINDPSHEYFISIDRSKVVKKY